MSEPLVWILLIVIAALIALLLIRDKPLRKKVAAFFQGIGRSFQRARLRRKIKSGQAAQEEILRRLGQAAWKAGHKPETSAEAVRELTALEEMIKAKNEDVERLEAETARIRQAQTEFLESQKARIREREEKTRPPREELGRLRTKLQEVESGIGKAEKAVREAEAERRRAEGEIAKIEADASLPPDRKQAREAELRTLVQAASQNFAAGESSLPPLREERAALNKSMAELQAILDDAAREIGRWTDEQKEKTKATDAQASDLAKKIAGVKSEVRDLTKKEDPRWAALGRDVLGRRTGDPSLTALYAEFDKLDQNLRGVEERLKTLRK
ncbi:MAG: hypothetical protein FJY82_00730 [Candidatus Aminicenantes bacterium]|nr:hypothetical protein [Candidatus Aminicenantes bacterium]